MKELPRFVYSLKHEKFITRPDDGWDINTPVTRAGLRYFLTSLGIPDDSVDRAINDVKTHIVVRGAGFEPNKDPIYREGSSNWVNLWTPSPLKPVPGPFPTIERVINWLTRGDVEGAKWLQNWMAYKAQNHGGVPKVAVVFATAQGGGKGFLALVMRHILGLDNTAQVKQSELENKFNSRWINKLFVLGDEILSSDNMRDISQKLKILIDGGEQELEGKGKDQFAVKSKLAWMFASNDRVTPVVLEDTDRRYTVFYNYDPVPSDYAATLTGCFKADRSTPTEAFWAEMAGFYAHLLAWPLDLPSVYVPYRNDARTDLIQAAKSSYEQFLEEIQERGIQDLLQAVMDRDFGFADKRKRWDFGDGRIAVSALYRCYLEFCKQSGQKALRRSKFESAMTNTPPYLTRSRPLDPVSKKRVWTFTIPGLSLDVSKK